VTPAFALTAAWVRFAAQAQNIFLIHRLIVAMPLILDLFKTHNASIGVVDAFQEPSVLEGNENKKNRNQNEGDPDH
jgi:hypothetical protein